MTDTPILSQLADLIDDELGAAFCGRPLLLPSDISVREELWDDPEYVGYMLLELLNHVGLSQLELQLEAWTLDPDACAPGHQSFEPINGLRRLAYAGGENDRARVIYDPEQPGLPDEIRGSAALLVARIYRDLVGPTPTATAEYTTDDELVALCLGLGPLLANARALTDDAASSGPAKSVRVDTLGMLSPYRIGYLLGAQSVARDADEEQRTTIRNALGPEPREGFDGAVASLDRAALAALDLPDSPDATGLQRKPVDRTRLQIARDSTQHRADVERALQVRNVDSPVFRVKNRKYLGQAAFGALVGLIAFVMPRLDSAPLMVKAAIPVLTGFLVGVNAYLKPRYQCSEPDCTGSVGRSVDTCPECGGTVVGEVFPGENADAKKQAWLEGSKPQQLDHHQGDDDSSWW